MLNRGSYTNLYDSTHDLPLGGSAHSLQTHQNHTRTAGVSQDPRGIVGPPGSNTNTIGSGAGFIPDQWPPPRGANHMTRPSPGIAKKREQRDVGNSADATQQKPPVNPHHQSHGQMVIMNSPSMDRAMSLASDAKYPTNQALITDTLGPSPPRPVISTHKSSSTGQLNKNLRNHQSQQGNNNNTTTANSQQQQQYLQQHQHHHPSGTVASNRTSPITVVTQQGAVNYYPSGTNSAGRNTLGSQSGGGSGIVGNLSSKPVGPASTAMAKPSLYTKGPAASSGNVPRKYKESSGYSSSTTNSSRHTEGGGNNNSNISHRPNNNAANSDPVALNDVSNVPGAVRRPMSFVKALEMSDQIQTAEKDKDKQRLRQTRSNSLDIDQDVTQSKQYGSSYEISV